jgi:hypothetical protein
MKINCKVSVLAILIFISYRSFGQEGDHVQNNTSSTIQEHHISIEKFPKDKPVNHIDGWGGMTVAVNEIPAGTDFSPLLVGLKNNSCRIICCRWSETRRRLSRLWNVVY